MNYNKIKKYIIKKRFILKTVLLTPLLALIYSFIFKKFNFIISIISLILIIIILHFIIKKLLDKKYMKTKFKNRRKINNNYFDNFNIKEICNNVNVNYEEVDFYIINSNKNLDLIGFCYYNNIHINEYVINNLTSSKSYENVLKGILTHELIHFKNNDSNYSVLITLDLTIFTTILFLLLPYNITLLYIFILLIGITIINIIIRRKEFKTEKKTIKKMNYNKDYINFCYRETFQDKNILSYILSNRPFRSDLDDYLNK